jgi:hypothetical protein
MFARRTASDSPPAVCDKNRLWSRFQGGCVPPVVKNFQAADLASFRRNKLVALLLKDNTCLLRRLDKHTDAGSGSVISNGNKGR